MGKPAAAHPSSNEADLVARARQGDAAAVRRIIRQHNQRLYRIARSIVRDDGEAEDVLQDASAVNLPSSVMISFACSVRPATTSRPARISESVNRMRASADCSDTHNITLTHADATHSTRIPIPSRCYP
jgi:RNA polymerase sigma-70 factor, ECF subfamily